MKTIIADVFLNVLFVSKNNTYIFCLSILGHNCYHGWAPYKNNCYYFSTSEVTLREALVRRYVFEKYGFSKMQLLC